MIRNICPFRTEWAITISFSLFCGLFFLCNWVYQCWQVCHQSGPKKAIDIVKIDKICYYILLHVIALYLSQLNYTKFTIVKPKRLSF